MDAINKRREHILEETRKNAEESRILELKRLKEETMKCNIISQRIDLQEYCITKSEEVVELIEGYINNEEEAKNVQRVNFEQIVSEKFGEFEIVQPSEYFLKHPTDDSELVSNVNTPEEFLLSTLEIFGLPVGYLEGKGHFPDFNKEKENQGAAARFKNRQKKKKQKMSKRMQELAAIKSLEEEKLPEYFDLGPFLTAFKVFIECNSEIRSKLRMQVQENSHLLSEIFVDKYGESSFKKCLDVMTIEKKFAEKNITFSAKVDGNIGTILRCFGEINVQVR